MARREESAEAEPSQGLPPLSLHHLSLLRAEPLELVDAAAYAGFERVGLRIISPEPSAEVTALVTDRCQRAEMRRALDDSGIRLLDSEAVWIRPTTTIDVLEPVLEATADLGGEFVLTVGIDTDRPRLLSRLAQFAELAESYGLTVAVELISYSAIATVDDLATVVAALDDAVVPLVDSLQFFRSGADATDAAILDTARYVQLSDGPRPGPSSLDELRREARTDRLPPGAGEFDLVGLLDALPRGIPLAVEAPGTLVSSLPLREAASLLRRTTLQTAQRAYGMADSSSPASPRS